MLQYPTTLDVVMTHHVAGEQEVHVVFERS